MSSSEPGIESWRFDPMSGVLTCPKGHESRGDILNAVCPVCSGDEVGPAAPQMSVMEAWEVIAKERLVELDAELDALRNERRRICSALLVQHPSMSRSKVPKLGSKSFGTLVAIGDAGEGGISGASLREQQGSDYSGSQSSYQSAITKNGQGLWTLTELGWSAYRDYRTGAT